MTRISMKTISQLNDKDLKKKIQEARSELAKLRVDGSKGTLRKESVISYPYLLFCQTVFL